MYMAAWLAVACMYMLYMYIIRSESTDGRRDPQHVDCIGSRSMTHTTEPTTSSLIETARHQLSVQPTVELVGGHLAEDGFVAGGARVAGHTLLLK